MQKSRILAIVGPTASGKSALAEELAVRLGGEIVSCDSMQVYRGLDIGTAKPDSFSRARVPYHLIDVIDPDAAFSAMDYRAAAEAAVTDIVGRDRLPVFCGGTGLYLETFLRGDGGAPAADPALRQALLDEAKEKGAGALYAELCRVDPAAGAAIHPANVRRVVRALELYRATGVTKTEWDRRAAEQPPRYDALVLCLTYTDRALLYRRIDERVDAMMAAGLLDEVKKLAEAGVFERSPTAAAAIGYKELLPCLDGRATVAEAVEELKQATRRYAKRQITWFSARPYVTPLPADDESGPLKFEKIVNNAQGAVTSAFGML